VCTFRECTVGAYADYKEGATKKQITEIKGKSGAERNKKISVQGSRRMGGCSGKG
jgi:hypothetical protein